MEVLELIIVACGVAYCVMAYCTTRGKLQGPTTLFKLLTAFVVGAFWSALALALAFTLALVWLSWSSQTGSFQAGLRGDDQFEAENMAVINDPNAVDPQDICPGYKIADVEETPRGLTAHLALAGTACNVYGKDVRELILSVEYQAKGRLHVEIQPRYIGSENRTWFILPEELVPKPVADAKFDLKESDLEFSWAAEPTFSFTVKRKATGDVLFTSAGSKLVFEDQFFEIGTQMPDNYNLYGLGEVIHGFRLGNNLKRTLWNVDALDPIDRNVYGSHPIYLDTRYFGVDAETGREEYAANATDDGRSYRSYTHGVFLRNVHALEVLLRESNLTWRGLGGTLDLYFYAGPSAKDVMGEFQVSTAGLPAMQPYWGLGYHQCKWGYKGWWNLKEVLGEFEKEKIPVDTIWADLDYMVGNRDFTNNPDGWGDEAAAEFFDWLHGSGRQFVPIVDASTYVPDSRDPQDGYATFDRGMEAKAFIMNPDGSLYIGRTAPGYAAFPDWVGATLGDSKTFEWWEDELSRWHKHVPFDGIWIDMNEVSSYCDGSCGSKDREFASADRRSLPRGHPREQKVVGSSGGRNDAGNHDPDVGPGDGPGGSSKRPQDSRHLLKPPYVIDNVLGPFSRGIVAPNAMHHDGTVEYDMHNVWGHQCLNATHSALKSIFPGKRPFIIGRSTFTGSGKYAGHWGGDNFSQFRYMALSIAQGLSFSIFGIPMFGVDACGFSYDTEGELCARWMQLAAFFPFYRNHNIVSAAPQEPYRWPETAAASRNAMRIRYALLPYLYTLFHKAHTQGDTLLRALAWEFPNEPWLAEHDRQFLLGPAIMVAPVLEQGARKVTVDFPGTVATCGDTVWYDWYTQQEALGEAPEKSRSFKAPVTHIPVFIRGGHVIPLQQPGMTTRESRRNKWELLVALDKKEKAKGDLYIDDGESIEPAETLTVEFSVKDSCLTAKPSGDYKDSNPLALVVVMNAQVHNSSSLTFNGVALNRSALVDVDGTLLSVDLTSKTETGAWDSEWTLCW